MNNNKNKMCDPYGGNLPESPVQYIILYFHEEKEHVF